LNRRDFLSKSSLSLGAALAASSIPGMLSNALAAEAFPQQPIRILVGFTAGGVTDVVVRSLAEEASKIFGQPVIVENKPGAGGVLPGHQLQNARPDGYTIGIIPMSVYRLPYTTKINWDPVKDLEYVIRITGFTWGLVVPESSPIQTFEQYVEYAKKHPGELTYGTVGTLTTQHLTMEQISRQLGIQLTHVPYKGVADAIPALLGGHIMSVADASSWVPYVESGKMRLLVIWSDKRVERFPSVPTLREVGIDMVQTSPWGLAAPKGTPQQVVQALHDGFQKAMQQAAFLENLKKFDMTPQYMNGEQFRQFATESVDSEARILKALDVPRAG